jgi:hypothetical protein
VAAQLAGLTGVVLYEIDDYVNARAWLIAAETAAREAEDDTLRAWVLVKKALIPTYTGAPARVLELMGEGAHLVPHGSGVVAARVHANAARAHATLGNLIGFETSMATARRAFDQAPAEDRRGGVFCFTDKQLAFYTGTGYLRLGRPDATRDAVVHAMTLYQPSELMDPAIMRIDVATSHLQDNEVEAACRVGIEAMDVPEPYRSGSLLQRTVELRRELLGGHGNVPAVQDFDEHFHEWIRLT